MSEYHLAYRIRFLLRIWYFDVRRTVRWRLRHHFGWRVKDPLFGGRSGLPIILRAHTQTLTFDAKVDRYADYLAKKNGVAMIPDGGYEHG